MERHWGFWLLVLFNAKTSQKGPYRPFVLQMHDILLAPGMVEYPPLV